MAYSITPIPDHLALEIIGEENILVVGDLHVGLESEIKAAGVHMPSQTHKMEAELFRLSQGRDRLVILGDVKNKVPGSSQQEYAELPGFFRKMKRAFASVDIVRGNHDTNIEDFLPGGIEVRPATGFALDGVGFIHGHTWPSADVMAMETLIMAHNHPAIALEDSLGNVSKEPCWVRFRIEERTSKRYLELPKEVIMVPAFNRCLGGSPVNIEGGKLLGPMFSENMMDISTAGVYLPDGIYLGTVESLMIRRAPRRVRTSPFRHGQK